jgi:dihydroxyacetone kinase-like protein
MKKVQLTLKETKDMFIFISQKMEESKDILTQADKKIGDGDHGVGMARGFAEVKLILAGGSFSTIKDIFNMIGMTLLSSIGGAAGAIFGTLFSGAAKNLKNETFFNANTLSQMLIDGLETVKQRGKAKIGDKTMVDALEPAALKSKEVITSPLNEALIVVSEAARLGMENTKNMIATIGKAKTLGERSLGHPDPGAISIYLILKFMSDYVN